MLFSDTFLKGLYMKKILVAAALLASASAALAQTAIYGRINATVDSTKTGAVRANGMVNDISNFGITVREDLGNGLQARAQVETSIASHDPMTGAATQLGDRQSTVGLTHRMGSVDLGRNVHGLFLTVADSDAFNALYGSIAGDIHNLRGLRISNGAFVRVNAMPGVSLGIDTTHTPVGAEARIYSAGGSLGPVRASLARYDQGTEVSTVLGASTKLGATSLFYSFSDNKGAVTQRGHLAGASHKIGVYTVKAGYGRTDNDIRAWNVGAEYALSKRTDLLISYRNVDKVATANDIKQIGVGVTHRF